VALARSLGLMVLLRPGPFICAEWEFGYVPISRLTKNVGLICRISSFLQGSFEKETYSFKEPTNRSHSICAY